MKKFLVCILVLSIGLSCSDNHIVCGCVAPVRHFSLVIRNAQGADLLNPQTPGAYSLSQIKVRYQDGKNAKLTEVQLKEPFTYGDHQVNKFAFYQLISAELTDLATFRKPREFSIDLADASPAVLTVDPVSPDIIRINGVLLNVDTSLPDSYGKVYYWNR